jgi:photosystem II stability/assembly factor-like uncharacterized protein
MKGTSMKNICYFITSSVVIFYSSLNAQWIHLSGGPENDIVSHLADDQQTLYAGSAGPFKEGIFISTDQGINWLRPDSTILAVNAFAFGDELDVFAGRSGTGIYRSTNGGLNWSIVNSGLTNTSVNSLTSTGTNLFAGTLGGGVFLSTNNGSLWVEVNSGLTNPIILTLAANPLNVFAGSYGGGVFVSSNNGSTWSSANSGLTDLIINTIAIAGENVFTGTLSGVFRTTDNGSNWTQVNSGLIDTSITTISVIGMNIFAGTPSGVFLSSNNGDAWLNVSSGLPNYPVLSIAFDSTYIYAGLYYGGVWRRPLSEMITGVVDQSSEIPSQFILEQNYPNPFNPSTKIRYSVPQSSNVIIKVFDILGNEIETFVNEEKPTGIYEILFNSHSGEVRNLPSGIYFYQLRATNPSTGSRQGFIETKKMILLK